MLWNSINLIWMRPRTAGPEESAMDDVNEESGRLRRTAENGLGVLPVCMLDMVCRLMEPVRNDKFHLLTISVIDPDDEMRSKCYDGCCEISIPWCMEGFFNHDDLGKKREIVMLLEAGLRAMDREYRVYPSSALDACRKVKEVGYRNVWMLGRKRSKGGAEAVVTAECSTERTVVTLSVFQKQGQLVRQEVVIDLGPEAGGLKQQYLAELLWEDDEVVLRGKYGFEYRLDLLSATRGRVRYGLRPYESVGSIILGFSGPTTIPWAIGEAPREVLCDGDCISRQVFANVRTRFSREGKCTRVDFFGSADLQCCGISVIGRAFEEVVRELCAVDGNVVVRGSMAASGKFGLMIACRDEKLGLVDEASVYCLEAWEAEGAKMFRKLLLPSEDD